MGKGYPFPMLAMELSWFFFLVQDLRKGTEWKDISNNEQTFYGAWNVTELKADLMGKGINSFQFENQVCKAVVFNTYFSFTP